MQLVIDSATAACTAALINGGQVVAKRHELIGRGHAERLLPLIEEMLDGQRPSSVLVGCGPGSFTGLRVALAAAHGLAIGWSVPLAGMSTLALIAAGADAGDQVAVALHGGHGQFFVQTFATSPLEPLDPVRSLLPEEAAEAIDAPLVLGSAAEELVALRGSGEWRDALPNAADAIRLPDGLRNLEPRPIYGRAPDAKPRS